MRTQISGSILTMPCIVEPLEQRMLLSAVTGSSVNINSLVGSGSTPPMAAATPGFTVGAMKADPQRDIVYLLDQSDKQVVALDTDQGRIVQTANLAAQPTDLAISVDDSELYVTMQQANEIQVFSLPSMHLLRTLAVTGPGRIAAGAGNNLYVAGAGTWHSVLQVDGQTGAVLNKFGSFYCPLPRTNPTGTLLFISELGLSTTGTDEYDISQPGIAPQHMTQFSTSMENGRDFAVDEQYSHLYAMSGGKYGIYTVDMNSGKGSLWAGPIYGGAVGFTASSPYVWAGGTNPYDGNVYCYDRASGTLIAKYHTVTGMIYPEIDACGIQVTPNGNVLCKVDGGYYSDSHMMVIVGLSSLVVRVDRSLSVSDSSGNATDKSVVFPETFLGQTGSAQTFTLSSVGVEPLTVSSWVKPDPSQFTVTVQDNQGNSVDTSSAFTIPGNTDYTVTVTMSTASLGDKSSKITFKTNDSNNSSVTLAMSGTVLSDQRVSVSDSSGDSTDESIAFTDTFVGQVVDPQTFVLSSTGIDPLTVSHWAGPDPADFTVAVQDDKGNPVDTSNSFMIPAGTSYTVSVTITTSNPGDKSGQITFNTDDARNGSISLAMNGTVLSDQRVSVSDSSGDSTDESITFPDTSAGQEVDPETFILSSTGIDPLTVSNWKGPDPVDFSAMVQDDQGNPVNVGDSFMIPAGASYTVYVTMTTSKPGDKSGQITFNTDDTINGSISLAMNGTVLAPTPDLTISLTQPTYVPGHTIDLIATIANIGGGLAQVDPKNPIVVDFSWSDDHGNMTEIGQFTIPVSIAAGASMQRPISFYPLGAGDDITIVATVDVNDVVAQDDYTNDSFETDGLEIPFEFGAIPGQRGSVPLTFRDTDGTIVTMKLTGGGYGVLDNSSGYNDISIFDSTTKSNLQIQTQKTAISGDDGRFTLDELAVGYTAGDGMYAYDYTSLGVIDAPTTDLTGWIDATGTLGTVSLGNVDGPSTITTNGALDSDMQPSVLTLQFGTVKDLTINANLQEIKSLKALCWLNTDGEADTISADSIGTLIIGDRRDHTVPHDFEADLSVGAIGTAKIDGNLTGSWEVGDAGTIEADGIVGSVDNSWSLNANSIRNLKLGDVLNADVWCYGAANSVQAYRWQNGSITASGISSLSTSGWWGMKGYGFEGDFGADVNIDPTAGSQDGSPVNPSAIAIGTVKINGQITQGAWNILGAVSSLTAKSVSNTDITANSVATFIVKGDLIGSQVHLNQMPDPKRMALGKMTISGTITQSELRSNGNIGSITAAVLDHSNIFAGVDDSVTGLPQSSDDFVGAGIGALAMIHQLKLTGIRGTPQAPVLTDSNVAARVIAVVKMPKQNTALLNAAPGEPFGFASRFGIRTYVGPNATGSFVLRVI